MVNLNRLSGILREKKKTQHDVAVYLGVSDTTVSAKMNGKIKFDIDQAYDISVLLELTPKQRAEIFFWDEVAQHATFDSESA